MKKAEDHYVVGIVNVEHTLSTVIEQEFSLSLPKNVEILMSHAPLEQVSYKGLMKFLDALPKAVDKFIENKPDLIVVPSMTGSCIKGEEIVNVLEQYSGIPVIVPAIEIVNCLQELQKNKVAIISAFGVELGLLEQLFFRNHGIQVTEMVSVFDNPDGKRELIDTMDNQLILDKIKEVELKEAEVVIFDNPTYRLRPIIEEIKKYIHIPMLSVNQVLILSTLKRLGLPAGHIPVAQYFIS